MKSIKTGTQPVIAFNLQTILKPCLSFD